jgi:hypothetical protein
VKVVIQCAASKSHNAGFLIDNSGRHVSFNAKPHDTPKQENLVFAHPDESYEGSTWREKLLEYNTKSNNPLNLLRAHQLYSNPAYSNLVTALGLSNVYILSAGWGLLSADFLTPYYDITFSGSTEKYKRRGKRDQFNDINQLDNSLNDDLVFFGGKDYLPLFCELTAAYRGKRFVYSSSAKKPAIEGVEILQYSTATRTN